MPDKTNTIVDNVTYCDYKFKPWYSSPGYFEDSKSKVPGPNSTIWDKEKLEGTVSQSHTLHVCDHCFKYSVDEAKLIGHKHMCNYATSLPGQVVYDDFEYKIYQVDGRQHKLFCQCLCLFGKLFLDSKSIYYTVEDFHFFLLVESIGKQRIVGFFSREKVSWDDCNLACLLVFPPFQKRGLGRLLIAFSYHLSLAANKIGSPERPLSEHGLGSYRSYWIIAISQVILRLKSSTITCDDISAQTGIEPGDVMDTLEYMGALSSETDGSQKTSILVGTIRQFVASHNISTKPTINKKHCFSV
jgi:histone acetyltransferase SAS2